jgi:hypothetical protein
VQQGGSWLVAVWQGDVLASYNLHAKHAMLAACHRLLGEQRAHTYLQACIVWVLLAVECYLVLLRTLWHGTPAESCASLSLACRTSESEALSKALRTAGMTFVGPTIMYAFMQAAGLVNDHLVSCHCRSGSNI